MPRNRYRDVGASELYVERDLQTLSSIAALPDFRRLMRAACRPMR